MLVEALGEGLVLCKKRRKGVRKRKKEERRQKGEEEKKKAIFLKKKKKNKTKEKKKRKGSKRTQLTLIVPGLALLETAPSRSLVHSERELVHIVV